jgi:hypothetical protein
MAFSMGSQCMFSSCESSVLRQFSTVVRGKCLLVASPDLWDLSRRPDPEARDRLAGLLTPQKLRKTNPFSKRIRLRRPTIPLFFCHFLITFLCIERTANRPRNISFQRFAAFAVHLFFELVHSGGCSSVWESASFATKRSSVRSRSAPQECG